LAPAPACAAERTPDGTERRHHLVALWPVAARAALRAWLAAGRPCAVGAFAAALGTRAVRFPDAPEGAFLNVNTPAELEMARALAADRT
ncbi:MAG: molybdenum cofactor guanylyltransferase, partial [Rhodospirillales bacterium]|nr:molybdenum cofactor guanylyltransferase [Rhodospirillales bacterium]